MLLLEVKAVLTPDDRSKGVLKTGRVTGNPTIGLAEMLGRALVSVVYVGELLVNGVTGVLETVDVTGISEASVEGTLTDTVVTGGPDTSGGGLVTTGEVAAATCGSTV